MLRAVQLDLFDTPVLMGTPENSTVHLHGHPPNLRHESYQNK